MGLACEVFRELTGRGEWVQPEKRPDILAFKLDTSLDTSRPMEEVLEFFGLDDAACDVMIGLNDCEPSSRYPLEVLADIIVQNSWEKEYRKLIGDDEYDDTEDEDSDEDHTNN